MLFQYSENFILLACVAAGPRTRQNHLNYTHVAIQFQAIRRKSRLKAAKKKFAQSKCRILHALHKLRKKRAEKPLLFKCKLTLRPGGGGGHPYETDGDARRKFLI